MRCFLFDIDGTIADLSHRLHHIQNGNKDWRSFFAGCDKDKPIAHMCALAKVLGDHHLIIFVSGRSDECRDATIKWLQSELDFKNPKLYMRKAGDHRPDNLVKSELLDQILSEGYEPFMAFDDRNQVVKMWRERGIPCAQVADGDF